MVHPFSGIVQFIYHHMLTELRWSDPDVKGIVCGSVYHVHHTENTSGKAAKYSPRADVKRQST